jgi:type VI secretion system secreted protein VgrG
MAFNIRFPGQYFDQETGLHYNRFRYYDPELGRYISADPIGQFGLTADFLPIEIEFVSPALASTVGPKHVLGGASLYVYGFNSPLRYIDPFGLDGTDVAIVVTCTVVGCALASPGGVTVPVGCAIGTAVGGGIVTARSILNFESDVESMSEGAQDLIRDRIEEADRASRPD